MKKLTKHQRQYRKRKKDSKKDFRRVTPGDRYSGVRVTRMPLCIRVSLEASERLLGVSQEQNICQWELLTRIIIKALPSYSNYREAAPYNLERYSWRDDLLNPSNRVIKYKGATGQKQLNLSITSTAWKKLECHKTATGLSKARIVQSLILNYKPMSAKNRELAKQRREEAARQYSAWSPDQKKPFEKTNFFFDGNQWRHKRAIPEEYWDEAELDDYLAKSEALNKRLKSDAEKPKMPDLPPK